MNKVNLVVICDYYFMVICSVYFFIGNFFILDCKILRERISKKLIFRSCLIRDFWMYECLMVRWMNVWLDGWMNGWVDEVVWYSEKYVFVLLIFDFI